jgi:hypothetical protein
MPKSEKNKQRSITIETSDAEYEALKAVLEYAHEVATEDLRNEQKSGFEGPSKSLLFKIRKAQKLAKKLVFPLASS